MSYSDRFQRALAEVPPEKIFLKTDCHVVKYGSVFDAIGRLFAFFRAKGLTEGKRIGVLAREPADIAVLVLSAMRQGLSVVVINPELQPGEVALAVEACGLDHLFHEDSPAVQQAVPETVARTVFASWATAPRSGLLGRLRKNTAVEGPARLTAILEEYAPAEPVAVPSPETVALILYTSGTTNKPKVVELTQRNIAAQLEAFDEVYDYCDQSRLHNPLPMHFTDGLFHGPIATFIYGATLYRPTEFDITKLEDLLNEVYRESISHLIVVPAILALMDRMGAEYEDTFQSGNFRYIRSSGDRLPTSLWRSIEARFSTRVVNTYGMSETVCEAFYSGPSNDLRKVGTVGKAVGCCWKIVDEDGAELAPGGTGELLIRGDIITRGYRGQPNLTAENIVDGWLKTGDLATASDDGFLTIAGRKKDLIISGGVNIHPQEITDCLLQCDGVADAITFGLPHGVWGEQVAAAIIPKLGATIDQTGIMQHCQRNLAPHKTPRLVKFTEAFPRNPAGKVLVKQLRAEFQSLDMSQGSDSERSVQDRVLAQAAEVFGTTVDNLHLRAEPATTAGWDSFAHLTLITALETQFDVTFSAQEMLRIDSLANLVDVLLKKQS